jgi:DNA-binding IclR family transcriptional regulator
MTGARTTQEEAPDADERAGVQSVGIAFTILKALANGGGMLPLKSIAAAAGMPRAKVHRYLASLRQTGMIAQDAETGHYQIGPAAVSIGLVGLGRLSPVRQLHDALPRLRDRINETVTAAVWGDRGPTIIAMEESDHVVTMNVRVGSVLPLLGSVIGRLFLAYQPPASAKRLIAAERRGWPADAPPLPSEQELDALLAEIRARRLSGARAPLLPGVDAVAAPVFDHRAKLVAVICAVGRSGAMPTRPDGPVVRALVAAGDELSRRLGFIEPAPTTESRD